MDFSGLRRTLVWIRHTRPRHYLSVILWLCFAGAAVTVFTVNLGIMPTLLTAFFLAMAHRTGATSGVQLLAMYPDVPPILYLRSFAADETRYTRPSDDQILSSALRPLGPNITFGDPGRLLAHLGPGRILTGYRDDWMEGVEEYMGKSRLVVLKVGDTPGVLEEARHLLATVEPTRILFCFSIYLKRRELHALYQTFAEAMAGELRHPLPPLEQLKNHRCIRLDEEGRPELLANLRTPSIWWRFLIGPLARPPISLYLKYRMRHALGPIFTQYGQTAYNRTVFSFLAVAAAAYLGGAVGAGAMLAWNGIRLAPASYVQVGIGLALAGSPFLHPYVAEILSILQNNFVLVLGVLVAWPLLCSSAITRHREAGGRFSGVIASLLAIAVLLMVSGAAPTSTPVEPGPAHYNRILDIGDLDDMAGLPLDEGSATIKIDTYLLRNSSIHYRHEYETETDRFILQSRFEQFTHPPGMLSDFINRGIGPGSWPSEELNLEHSDLDDHSWLFSNAEGVSAGNRWEVVTEDGHWRTELLGLYYEQPFTSEELQAWAAGYGLQ